MDFLVYSDLHAHPFKFGSKWVVDEQLGPINSRLLDAVNCIRQIVAYAKEHSIEHVFFAGDMFHVPDRPPTDAVSAIYKTIAAAGVKFYMIPGNHDIASKNGKSHALVPFSDVAEVFTDYGTVNLGSVVVHMVPYRESKAAYLKMVHEAAAAAENPKGWQVLISHVGIQGAKVGADYVLNSDQDVALDDLPLVMFNLSLFGHFHEHQKLDGNAYFIGAPNQHNWGDAGTERGFLHVSNSTFKRVPLNAPRFHRLKVGADVSDVQPGDFVEINAGKKSVDAVKKAASEAMPDVAYLDVKPEKEIATSVTVTLPTSWAHNELLGAWIGAKGPDRLDKKKLLNLGLKFLGEAYAEEE